VVRADLRAALVCSRGTCACFVIVEPVLCFDTILIVKVDCGSRLIVTLRMSWPLLCALRRFVDEHLDVRDSSIAEAVQAERELTPVDAVHTLAGNLLLTRGLVPSDGAVVARRRARGAAHPPTRGARGAGGRGRPMPRTVPVETLLPDLIESVSVAELKSPWTVYE